MANKPSSDSNLQSTLQRGKACLRCRQAGFFILSLLFSSRPPSQEEKNGACYDTFSAIFAAYRVMLAM